MTSNDSSRLVVLVSGNGSNLQAILDACGQAPHAAGQSLNARVVAVVSNQPNAYALARATQAGVPTVTFPRPKELDRTTYDAMLAGKVAGYQPDWIVLAGWMRLLSDAFLKRFPNQVINLHPALPGAFPGTHSIERAFEAFHRGEVEKTGVMVHLVPDEGVDNGPILAQEEVSILHDEDLSHLEERIHQVEHRLLVSVLQNLTR